MKGLLFGAAALALVPGDSAAQQTMTLNDLLLGGYTVVDSEFIADADVDRAMNNAAWVDDVMLTLQRGASIAFCHLSLVVTADNADPLTYNCKVLNPAPAAAAAATTPAPAEAPTEAAPQ